MIRHLIVAAWRNMAANKLLSVISILGLSVGIAAAILMGLVIRNQMSFDAYLPMHERTYLAASPPHPLYSTITWSTDSDFRTENVLRGAPGVESVASLLLNRINQPMELKQGDVTGWETFYWADPNIFDVLRLPVLRGDLATALERPDGIVLPRAVAEKYFGRDDAVGRVLTLDGHPMVVRAVIRDLPTNGSGLQSGIFVSGIASFSRLAPAGEAIEALGHDNNYELENRTYVRLKPSANIGQIESIVSAYWKPRMRNTERPLLKLLPLAGVNVFGPLNSGIRTRLMAAGLAGLLVLFISTVNFVNLMVSRSARREREIGVRKALGAGRGALILQFLGEAMIAVILAAGIAAGLSEWLLPAMNAILGAGARLDYVGDPRLMLVLLFCVAVLSLATGAYPAFLLSSVRPANVLRGWVRSTSQGQIVRDLLVAMQFAILVVLAISAWVIWQQREYATHEALRINTDQMLLMRLLPPLGTRNVASGILTCAPALENELRKLPGVESVGCSGTDFIKSAPDRDSFIATVNGHTEVISGFTVSPGLLKQYGLNPLAGSLDDTSGSVVNMALVRRLGFASPQAAIGHSWIPSGFPGERKMYANQMRHTLITAVVPDFAPYSVAVPIEAAVFTQWLGQNAYVGERLLHIKLNGDQIPQTLAAIDSLWAATDQNGPLDRFFLNDYMQRQYLDMTREATLLGTFAVIAIFLACLGLVGIAMSTAERRTKEIGIRKTMGATTGEIVTLLLWQFSQPILWANVIAWPIAWWLMRRWLSGFAYHVDLHWWVFTAASAGALIIALLSVAGQAFLTARQKPVLALRYE